MRFVYLLLLSLLAACAPAPQGTWQAAALRLEPYFSGLKQPTDLRFLPGGDGRALATEQRGRLVLLGEGQPRILFDMQERTSCCGEQGLLSLVLHPDFARNGLVFLYGSNEVGDTVLSRVRLRLRTLTVGPGSYEVLRTFAQPGPTHNGGQLQFGPDGRLYLSLGDGLYRPSWLGALPSAQERDTPLGKLLRFTVTERGELSIPRDNPFVAQAEAEGAAWALGLRNPWRFSFDAATGDLFLADVGETGLEEVTVRTLTEAKGANFGWPLMEGTRSRGAQCDALVAPDITYPTRKGCAITGGYVYRGTALPDLAGTYIFGDYCTGVIWGAAQRDGAWHVQRLLDSPLLLSSFVQDEAGEVYALGYGRGVLYRLAPAP